MKTEAKINVTTIGVEKANTIAIYETNGTAFNEHYQEQERMNLLQLYVNDSGTGTPFVEDPNVIVIPTSLFTETVFNAYVQNETLSETPIYSADEDIFMFISVGRDGNTEQACEEIDFIFIRFEISSEDAMEVLTLLLTCLVNETTNETAIVYSYVSTKLNDTTAVMMNLPFSVLGFIPWFCDFTESPIGSKPETKGDVFWKPLKTLGKAIVGVVIFLGMVILAFVEQIVDFVADILMEWLPILEYILWLIIRVMILIFIWIMFAFTLLIVITSFVVIAGLIMTLNIFIDIDTKISLNEVIVEGDINLFFKFITGTKYNDYLAFFIPALEVKFEADRFCFSYVSNELSEDLIFTDYSGDLFYNFTNIELQQSSSYTQEFNDTSPSDAFIIEGLTYFGVGMSLAGGFVTIIASILTFTKDPLKSKLVTFVSFIFYILSITMVVLAFAKDSNSDSMKAMYYGLGFGIFIAGIFFFYMSKFIGAPHKYMKTFLLWIGRGSYERARTILLILSVFDFICNLAGLIFDFEDIINGKWGKNIPNCEKAKMGLSLFAGFLSLFLAGSALVLLGGHYNKAKGGVGNNKSGLNATNKSNLAFLFGIGSIIIGTFFLSIASNLNEFED